MCDKKKVKKLKDIIESFSAHNMVLCVFTRMLQQIYLG